MLSHSVLSDSATAWTVAHQAPLSMVFSRQEHWSGLPFPTPGDLPNSGIQPKSPASLHWQADSLPLCHLGSPDIVQTENMIETEVDTEMELKMKTEGDRDRLN